MTQLNALLTWYSTLTPETVDQLDTFYHPEARFKDPFNDVRGTPAIKAIFYHMFTTTTHPRFIILERMEQGNQAFVSWRFDLLLKGKSLSIPGCSHLHFDAAGIVIEHRDYWDPAEELFEKLPIIGTPIRWLRRQFLVDTNLHHD